MSREGREGRGSSGGGSSSSVSLRCCRLGWGGGVPIPILNAASCRAGAAQWWRRQHVQEFFPTVSLGDPTLDGLLAQHGLKVGSTPHTSPSPVGHSLKLTPPPQPLVLPPAPGQAALEAPRGCIPALAPELRAPTQPPLLPSCCAVVPLPGGCHHLPAACHGPPAPGGCTPHPPQSTQTATGGSGGEERAAAQERGQGGRGEGGGPKPGGG